jgi:drug/metabolite transporter (DMT)-like permease
MTAPAAPLGIVPASGSVEAPNARKGMLLMLTGLALFSILNALVKGLSEFFPLSQIIFFRNVVALVPLLLFARSFGGLGMLRMKNPGRQFLQGLLFTLVLLFIFFAYRHMPLADATAITFAQPLIVLMLSLPLLAERVTRMGWIAVGIGFCGVLLMAQPTGNVTAIGVGAAVIGTVFSALSLLQQRHLSRSETSLSIVFWTLAFSGMLMLPAMLMVYVQPTPLQWALLIGNGLASGLCQYLTTRALYHASASTIAPINYTKIIWALLLGYLWFGDVPGTPVILGSSIVILAGYLAYRETGVAVKPV